MLSDIGHQADFQHFSYPSYTDEGGIACSRIAKGDDARGKTTSAAAPKGTEVTAWERRWQ
jgi:hypothetical protein